jgi:hypothetical protein
MKNYPQPTVIDFLHPFVLGSRSMVIDWKFTIKKLCQLLCQLLCP